MRFDQKLISVPCRPETIGHRNTGLGFVLQLSNLLAAVSGPEGVLEAGLRMVRDRFDFETGRVYLADEERGELMLHASQGMDIGGLQTMSTDEGFSGLAFSRRSFLAQKVEDLTDRERAAILTEKGLKSVVCVPLIVMDKVIGVINLGAKRVVELDQDQVDLMMVSGNIIAVAVQNSRAAQALLRQKEAIRFFAYTASHDLKGPVVGIGGLVRLLAKHEDQNLSPRGRSICAQIESAAMRLELLVGEINAYISASEAPLDLGRVVVADVLDEVIQDFSLRLESRGINFIRPAELPVISADRLGLLRVFENLVDNAIKYGGPELTSIEVTYGTDGAYHVFGVADDGVGLTAEQAATVFNVFCRSETSRGSQGSGLGLGIVRAVAERHGGRAWVERRPGGGCAFFVSLACIDPPPAAAAEAPPDAPATIH